MKTINVESRLMFASDHPYSDLDLPSRPGDLPFISEQARRDILGGNALGVLPEPRAEKRRERGRADGGVAG